MIGSFIKYFRLKYKTYRANKDLKAKSNNKVISGQTPVHIATNILLQVVLILVFVFGVEHATFPLPADVKDYPGLGEPGGPISIEAEPVIPFKRYPPGFDVFG